MMNAYEYIREWYKKNCDGDWEHQYGIQIGTLDNPGWEVRIDLALTELEDLNIEYKLFQQADDDWYGFSVKNKVFEGAGDPDKLETILEKFREIAEMK